MADENKKTETSPAPSKEVAPENKSSPGAKPSTTEAPRHLPPRPPPIVGGRVRNRFLKPIGKTGTGFSRREKSDNSSGVWIRPALPLCLALRMQEEAR